MTSKSSQVAQKCLQMTPSGNVWDPPEPPGSILGPPAVVLGASWSTFLLLWSIIRRGPWEPSLACPGVSWANFPQFRSPKSPPGVILDTFEVLYEKGAK